MDSNRGHQSSEATALPTEPKPQPTGVVRVHKIGPKLLFDFVSQFQLSSGNFDFTIERFLVYFIQIVRVLVHKWGKLFVHNQYRKNKG